MPRERVKLRPQRPQHLTPLVAALRLLRQGADGMRRKVPLPLAAILGAAENLAPSSQIPPPPPPTRAKRRQRRATGLVIVSAQGSEELGDAVLPLDWGFLRHRLRARVEREGTVYGTTPAWTPAKPCGVEQIAIARNSCTW